MFEAIYVCLCDARPTVTFLTARHHRPLAGTKLYCTQTLNFQIRFCRRSFNCDLEKIIPFLKRH